MVAVRLLMWHIFVFSVLNVLNISVLQECFPHLFLGGFYAFGMELWITFGTTESAWKRAVSHSSRSSIRGAWLFGMSCHCNCKFSFFNGILLDVPTALKPLLLSASVSHYILIIRSIRAAFTAFKLQSFSPLAVHVCHWPSWYCSFLV